MNKDINAIILLLATQALINLGQIPDPISGEAKNDLEGATTFIQLLDVLASKTQGNLTSQEEEFLIEIRENLDKVYNKNLDLSSGN